MIITKQFIFKVYENDQGEFFTDVNTSGFSDYEIIGFLETLKHEVVAGNIESRNELEIKPTAQA